MTKRRANDEYFTPGWATQILLRNEPGIGGAFVEPCCGDNAITNVLLNSGRFLDGGETNDIVDYRAATYHQDATQPDLWARFKPAEWVISNPPFNRAAEIVPRAYDFARQGVAMLLRLSYLEPCLDRDEWLETYSPTRLIVLPRISFTGDGKTDNVTCAWVVWDKFVMQRPHERPTHPIIIVPRPRESGQLALANVYHDNAAGIMTASEGPLP